MDKISLVDSDLEMARRLVSLLTGAGLPIQMAAWVRREPDAPFFLMIASPNIQKFGPRVADELLRETLQSSNLDLRREDIYLTNTTGMSSRQNPSFAYVFPVSGLHDEIFVYRSDKKVRATVHPPSVDAA